MPRKKRIWKLNHCHHIMLRGIRGKSIFYDAQDRMRFCLILQEAAERHSLRIHAFCLMSNHIHLIVEPTQGLLKDGIHAFTFRYAQYFNRQHEQSGYLFQGRFRSILVEDGLYLRRLTRYIHRNPVEAGLVRQAEEYPWSSYNAYFGRSAFTWLVTDHVLSRFGENRLEALAKLAEFSKLTSEAEADVEEIGKALRIGAYGSQEFLHTYAPEVAEHNENSHEPVKISLEELVHRVCDRFELSFQQLCGDSKTRTHVAGRSVLSRAWQLADGGSLGDICRALKKHHGTVSRLAANAAKTPELTSIVEELLSIR